MRLVLDARLYGLEHRGIGRYLVELVAGLAASDHETNYTVLLHPGNRSRPLDLPANFTCLPAPWRVYSLAEQIYMPKLLRRLRPDLIHFPHFSVPLMAPRPYVVTVHDVILHHMPSERATTLAKPLYWGKVMLYRLVVRQILKRAAAVIVPSQAVANDCLDFYAWLSQKLKLVPLAPGALPPPALVKTPERYFLVVGAAYPHKNLESAVAAVASLKQRLPGVKLVVVGRHDVFMQRLAVWVANRGYSDTVVFWGEASEAELSGLYHGALAYLLPSLLEGFGLGALEALAQGTLVVAADIPVLHEVLGQAAIFASPTDATAMAEVYYRVAIDTAVRQRLKTNTPSVLAQYSWTKVVRETSAVYRASLG